MSPPVVLSGQERRAFPATRELELCLLQQDPVPASDYLQTVCVPKQQFTVKPWLLPTDYSLKLTGFHIRGN
jgi:hypothetical protein